MIEKLSMSVYDLYLLQQKVNELIDFCNHIGSGVQFIDGRFVVAPVALPCPPAPEPDVAPDIHVPAITCGGCTAQT